MDRVVGEPGRFKRVIGPVESYSVVEAFEELVPGIAAEIGRLHDGAAVREIVQHGVLGRFEDVGVGAPDEDGVLGYDVIRGRVERDGAFDRVERSEDLYLVPFLVRSVVA